MLMQDSRFLDSHLRHNSCRTGGQILAEVESSARVPEELFFRECAPPPDQKPRDKKAKKNENVRRENAEEDGTIPATVGTFAVTSSFPIQD